MDDQVAVPQDEELRKLLSKFVCVRLIQMWGVDLRKFRFDHVMTWAVFFMNGDGTIYGRYGTRSAMQKQSTREISLAGFKLSMASALDLHARFAEDPAAARREVAGKQVQHAPPWPSPEKIPRLAKNERMARPFRAFADNRSARAHGVGCIHCHMVPNSEMLSLRDAGRKVPDRMVWPYPMPYAIGLHMDPRARSTARRVVPDSAASAAGLQPGDEILQVGGQTILSTADIQWVLHNAPERGDLPVAYNRDGHTSKTTVKLATGWRRRLGDWRFTNLGICMQIVGFNGRPTRGGDKRLAIRVQRVHRKRLAGIDLQRNDVIVALDGSREPMNLGQLTRFLLDKKPGSDLEIVLTRRGAERKLRFAVK